MKSLMTQEELALLYIMCSRQVAFKACKVIKKGAVLFPVNYPHLTFVFNRFLQRLAQAKNSNQEISIDKQEFSSSCLADLDQAELPGETKEKVKEFLTVYVEQDDSAITYEDGARYIKILVEKFCRRKLSREIGASTAFDALRKLVDKGTDMLSDLSADKGKKEAAINIIEHIPNLMRRRNKIAFGVPYLDYATCGGVCLTEMAMFGAGTGGGKSMTATDIACAQARLGNLTLWFTYEQPFDNDLSERIFANISGMELSNLRNKDFSELTEEQVQNWNRGTAGMSNNLVGVDYTSDINMDKDDPEDNGGVHSIEKQIIEQEQKKGKKVKFVILDWFGQIMTNLAANKGVDISGDNYRFFARDFITDLREMAQRRNVFILMFHQLSQKACDARPTYKPNKTDFQDIRTIANNFEWCFLMGKRDDNGVCWFNTDKARTCTPSIQTIQMDGEHARFCKVEGWSPGKDGNFHNYKQEANYVDTREPEEDQHTSDILRAYTITEKL